MLCMKTGWEFVSSYLGIELLCPVAFRGSDSLINDTEFSISQFMLVYSSIHVDQGTKR
jgi:hypothetical protein